MRSGTSAPPNELAARTAMLCAGLVIAQQVAAKAVRDALFLSSFDVTRLPLAMIGSALVSVLLALLFARALVGFGPGRLVPAVLLSSAALFAVEAALIGRFTSLITILVYLHVAAGGAVVVSAFWSLVSERFDPRAARRSIGRIAAGGAAGGVFGGLLAERTAAMASLGAALLLLSVLHGLAAIAALRFAHRAPAFGSADPNAEVPLDAGAARAGARKVRELGYLRNLALLVLTVTISGTLLDYVLKARAVQMLGDGSSLLRFFAVFYTAVSLFTFAVQTALSRPALERWGLAPTTATLPASVLAGGAVVLLLPSLANVAALRALEAVTKSSLFRSSYELFYTPLAPADKRAAKSVVDVGFDRLGDVAGGVLIHAGLTLGLPGLERELVACAMGLSMAALLLAWRLHGGYVRALERSLLGQSVALGGHDFLDRTTMSTLRSLRGAALGGEGIAELPRLIERLGDELRADASLRALRERADDYAPGMLRALADPTQPVAVRRRLPLALSKARPASVVAGLVAALGDERFEVRAACGRALARLSEHDPDFRVDAPRIYAAVEREVSVSRAVWQSRRLSEDGEHEPFGGTLIADRANKSLEHVFTLLALVLSREPLIAAHHALHSQDQFLRGTALEYLESVLPQSLRERLFPFLEAESRPPPSLRTPAQLEAELVKLSQTLRLAIAQRR
jgi:hypothetical protein